MIFKESLHEASPSNKAIRFRKTQDIGKQVKNIAFGTVEKPGRYKVPFDTFKGVLLEISFNEVCRTIPRIFTSVGARQERWLDVASNLSKILDTLRKQEEFTDDEIDVSDNNIHLMSKVWIGMFRREGMTNYFHLLSNGHTIYFLRKWSSLCRCSNQEWEYHNKQIWSRYYHHTNHSG
jgi:hypothetical protein